MAIEQTLVPAFINFLYDGNELTIVDANISLFFTNSCKFEESMTEKGPKGYMLSKGTFVDQQGDIFVEISKSGDQEADKTIDTLRKIAKEIPKSENPKDYAKSIVINFSDPGEQKFFSVSFSGYLKNFNLAPQRSGNAFTTYIAEFEVFDPLTIQLTN